MFQFQNGAIIRISEPPWASPSIRFQFQNGAIIRQVLFTGDEYIAPFQFQNGAIISFWNIRLVSSENSFNSKMVRL